ncbi:MAG: hypothetical protein RL189_1843 [Pseudomonadota bacterium]|jgi:hypothetical protein
MQRLFVTLKSFWSDWVRLDLNDDDLSDLEDELLESPEAGKLLRETGGVRKVRFARGGVGKRGGVRVFYLDFSELKKLYFLAVISKTESANLSKAERNELAALVRDLKGATQHEPLQKTQRRPR